MNVAFSLGKDKTYLLSRDNFILLLFSTDFLIVLTYIIFIEILTLQQK